MQIWPEYNLHGDVLNFYWSRLYEVFPDFQFVLYDAENDQVLAEGHTIPCYWDETPVGSRSSPSSAGIFFFINNRGQFLFSSELRAALPSRYGGVAAMSNLLPKNGTNRLMPLHPHHAWLNVRFEV